MPILERECDAFPEDLLSWEHLGTDLEERWWAVYTRSRQEKELMRALRIMQIPFFCPIIPHRYRSPAGRIRTSYLPLFTNYVFMYADGAQRYEALKSNCISSTIEVKDGPELTYDLRQIQRLIRAGAPLTLEDKLQPGSRVRIKSGALSGLVGVITKRQGQDHLFVAVNFLQQGATVRLEDFQIEPID